MTWLLFVALGTRLFAGSYAWGWFMFESVYRPTGRMNEFGGVYLAALNTYGDSHLCDRCSAI